MIMGFSFRHVTE